MKLYRFDAGVGETIDLFGSSGFVISKVARLFEGAIVNCAHLAPQGVIGFHQTTTDQLFLVVQGGRLGARRGTRKNSDQNRAGRVLEKKRMARIRDRHRHDCDSD